jgi:hypothetical protein
MPTEIIKHASRSRLEINPDRLVKLIDFLTIEIEDAFSARKALEANWRECLRMYDGVPTQAVKDFPVENAPNVEITIGAIAADSIFAQVVDLIFGTTPLVMCRGIPKRPNDEENRALVKACQRWVNYIATNVVKLRSAVEEMSLDNIQLGTGVLYIPWVERRKKTKVASVIQRKPKIIAMPPEDFLVPGGSYADLEDALWVALRFWLTQEQLEEQASVNNWLTEGIQSAGAKDWVRTRREALGKQIEGVERKGRLYDIYHVYPFFDIDGDGINEDLHVIWNHTGRRILKITYNPFDRRPGEKCCYQIRPHLFYGLGVLEMMRPFQHALTDFFNYWALNILLANCRIWKAKTGSIPETLKIWPNKVVDLTDPDDLKPEQMGEVYPSAYQYQFSLMQLAERRVGVNEMSNPQSGSMGNRTPGITALSMLQQINKRFTPAFDGMRECIARALIQCVYRYQERLLAGNDSVAADIMTVLGIDDGQLVISLLRDSSFDEHVTIELTAASASVNRESDRQNAVMLMNILTQYYTQIIQVIAAAQDPQTPPQVKEALAQVSRGANEMVDKIIRTFDQVRDPAAFLVEVEVGGEINEAEQGFQGQLMQALSMLGIGQEGLPPMQLPYGGQA